MPATLQGNRTHSDPAILSQSIHRGRQGITYTEIVATKRRYVGGAISDFRYRIEIERDSYDDQSHARISVWNAPTAGWSFVFALPWEHAASARYNRGQSAAAGQRVIGRDVPDVSQHRTDVEVLPLFREDAAHLLAAAREIVEA